MYNNDRLELLLFALLRFNFGNQLCVGRIFRQGPLEHENIFLQASQLRDEGSELILNLLHRPPLVLGAGQLKAFWKFLQSLADLFPVRFHVEQQIIDDVQQHTEANWCRSRDASAAGPWRRRWAAEGCPKEPPDRGRDPKCLARSWRRPSWSILFEGDRCLLLTLGLLQQLRNDLLQIAPSVLFPGEPSKYGLGSTLKLLT